MQILQAYAMQSRSWLNTLISHFFKNTYFWQYRSEEQYVFFISILKAMKELRMSKYFVWKCVATFLQRCELINVKDTTVPLCDKKLHKVWFMNAFSMSFQLASFQGINWCSGLLGKECLVLVFCIVKPSILGSQGELNT